MKIVIIGAGEVGFDLGSMLAKARHDVTILDIDKDALKKSAEKLDVLCIEGSGTSAKDLAKAGVDNADIVVAATSIDEVNMIASTISKKLGAKMVIARVRGEEYYDEESPLKPQDLGIDVMIHPEQSAAYEIVQLLKRASASDVITLVSGKCQLIGIKIDKRSPLIGKSLLEYAKEYSPMIFRVVAINRGGYTIIPFGSDKIQRNDEIFILAKTEDIPVIVESTGKKSIGVSNVMIAGGSSIGYLVAKMLSEESRYRIKLIEPDLEEATALAIELKNVLVLHGNPTDPDLLAIEGINEMDAFIAVTDDEESNIISCLMAKHLDVSKTVALVSKPDYIPLSQTIGLDTAINKKLSVSNEIHKHVRRGNVLSVSALHGINAEVLELKADFKAKIINTPLHKLKLPKGCVIGGIIEDEKVTIATGSTIIHEGDRVIVFCLPEAISAITSLFK